MILLRALQLPDDYPALARLLNEYWSEPTTAEKLEEEDGKLYKVGKTSLNEEGRLIGYDRERQVAVNERGEIVGYVWSWRAPWTEPGFLNNTLVVAPAHRGQGIGDRLLRHIADWASRLQASDLITEVWDDDPAALRFAERRGFVVERHSFQSVLSLEDESVAVRLAHTDVVREVEASGIRFLTLADEPGEANERKLYDMYVATLRDIPGFLGDVPRYSEWRKWYLYPEGDKPDMVLIAAEGDRYVGVANLIQNRQTGAVYHEYTAVSAAYRGRRIAMALKLLAIQKAIDCGAPYIRTDNDSLNAPMLGINRKLGYEPLRGRYRIVATLAQVQRALSAVTSLQSKDM